MQRKGGPRIFPLVLTVIVIALIIAALVSVGRAIFTGSQEDSAEEATVGQVDLLSTDPGRTVRVQIRGHIINDEDFRTYEVEVGPDKRVFTEYKGYEDDVAERKRYNNNEDAYVEFVYALKNANMMKGTEDPEKDDLRGICANGTVYDYAVINQGKVEKRLWTSTCSGSKGTLDASTEQLNDLFQDQIPNSEDMIPFSNGNGLKLQY